MNERPISIGDGSAIYLCGFGKGLMPDPQLQIDAWADQYMIIPTKSGAAEAGPYRTDRTPYAREPMRCLSPDHPCRRVVVKGASQLMKTQVGLNWIGAVIHQAPGNILALQPTLNVAKRFSHRVSETIKAVPELRDRVAEPRSRDSRNTWDAKEFDGGTLYIATAGSASNLAEIPARYLYCDEVDRWLLNVDGEGDPIELAEARTSTFEYNRKIYYSSSPTEKGLSLIENLYLGSDQRKLFLPCLHCGTMQQLEWERMRMKEDLSEAWHVCIECGAMMLERHKPEMLAAHEWRAQAAGDGGITVGFELSALYAPLGWVSWTSLWKQHQKAKAALERGDEEPMKVFYNTRLAIVWSSHAEAAKSDDLKARAEDYRLRTIQPGILVLTAAVDIQGNRIEVKIMGWGVGLERWVVDYQILWGSPEDATIWKELDDLLLATFPHPSSGYQMPISATCIDSGGHHTQEVYDFVRLRRHRKIIAIKGASRPGRPILSNKPAKVDVNIRGRLEKNGAELWFIGTDTAKDWLFGRWPLESGPGAIHFSSDLPEEYYHQLTAEQRSYKFQRGHKISVWTKEKSARNEALDLAVYNLAAAHYLGLHRLQENDWNNLKLRIDPPTRDLFADGESKAIAKKPEEAKTVESSDNRSRHSDLMERLRNRGR